MKGNNNIDYKLQVSRLLSVLELSKHATCILEEVEEIDDLCSLTEFDLTELGLNKKEILRLRGAIERWEKYQGKANELNQKKEIDPATFIIQKIDKKESLYQANKKAGDPFPTVLQSPGDQASGTFMKLRKAFTFSPTSKVRENKIQEDPQGIEKRELCLKRNLCTSRDPTHWIVFRHTVIRANTFRWIENTNGTRLRHQKARRNLQVSSLLCSEVGNEKNKVSSQIPEVEEKNENETPGETPVDSTPTNEDKEGTWVKVTSLTNDRISSSQSMFHSQHQKPRVIILPPSSSYEKAYSEFLKGNPTYIAHTGHLDRLRANEFSRLDEQKHIYLDYTGSGIYPASLPKEHLTQIIAPSILGNPHSLSPSSLLSTHLDHKARSDVLSFFNADPNEYTVIWTPNASGALKLLGESYPWSKKVHLLMTSDNHNSVVGIREYARRGGAKVHVVYVRRPYMRVPQDKMEDAIYSVSRFGNTEGGESSSTGSTIPVKKSFSGLLVYPAQSNMSGVQHPLEWVSRAQKNGFDVCLDTAAYVPSNKLDLSGPHRPEFCSISFYKIFGYPTGIGALIAKKKVLNKLVKPWFSGGSVALVSVKADVVTKYQRDKSAHWEDGTINFLGIPAISLGLKFIQSLGTDSSEENALIGVDGIHERVVALTGWLISKLRLLRHADSGLPLIRIYGPNHMKHKGGTITMNFFDSKGELIPNQVIDRQAAKRNMSIRVGCFCNPGAMEEALSYGGLRYIYCLNKPGDVSVKDFIWCSKGRPLGAVRVSIGMASNFADVWAFYELAQVFLNNTKTAKWVAKFRENYTPPESLC